MLPQPKTKSTRPGKRQFHQRRTSGDILLNVQRNALVPRDSALECDAASHPSIVRNQNTPMLAEAPLTPIEGQMGVGPRLDIRSSVINNLFRTSNNLEYTAPIVMKATESFNDAMILTREHREQSVVNQRGCYFTCWADEKQAHNSIACHLPGK
jgi:hypothetical protein